MTDPDGTTARRPADAKRWAALHADDLVGRPLSDADAAIQAAGLRTKVIRPPGATTLEFGIGRITVEVDDRDRVIGVRAG